MLLREQQELQYSISREKKRTSIRKIVKRQQKKTS